MYPVYRETSQKLSDYVLHTVSFFHVHYFSGKTTFIIIKGSQLFTLIDSLYNSMSWQQKAKVLCKIKHCTGVLDVLLYNIMRQTIVVIENWDIK